MSQPMIVWCVIAGVLLFVFVFIAIERYFTECHHNDSDKPRHLFEVGKDKDMFFVPGDFDEYDDYEDL